MSFPLTLFEWLLATGIMFLCAIVQGVIGFGLGMLGAPLLFLINPELVPAPVIIVGMLLPLMILIRDWRGVHRPDVAWALPGSVVGTLLGVSLLGMVSGDGLSLLFGTLVLFAVLLSVIGLVPRLNPRNIMMAGGLSGFMGSMTAIGGPPLALAFQTVSGKRLRGTLSAIFVPAGVMALTGLYFVGRFAMAELLMGLSLIPAISVGFWLSAYVAHWLEGAWLRPALLSFSALAGCWAILDALL